MDKSLFALGFLVYLSYVNVIAPPLGGVMRNFLVNVIASECNERGNLQLNESVLRADSPD